MSNFHLIKKAIQNQFDALTKHDDLFCTAIEKDTLWVHYLRSFPAGSNPIFKDRTEHDCSCCRQFIRSVGSVVAIVNGELVSIWDVTIPDKAYQAVADSMADLVKSVRIEQPFLHPERTVGIDKNYSQDADGKVQSWEHFHVKIPYGKNQGKNYFCPGKDIATKLGEAISTQAIFARSLAELTMDSVDTVLELISQNSIYRGNEHKYAVEAFRKLKVDYDKIEDVRKRGIYVWSKVDSTPSAVLRIRNTSIGTLLVDLSENLDLEAAVRKFEAVMAPSNYKRPTALVTQNMVKDAKSQVEKLGLSLERRFANLGDINVNDIIFADRHIKKNLNGSVFDEIQTKKEGKDFSKVEKISIDKFITDVVPNVESIEVLFENKQVNNLVSLIAPVDKNAVPMFKWHNNFSWSYNGDVTDSIKERVKKAGGNVTGDLCCRLAWFNYDDLDLRMKETGQDHKIYEIYYGNRYNSSPNGGQLDVDANSGGGSRVNGTRTPVENIFYQNRADMKEGVYELFVHQWRKVENVDIGFEAEIDYLGTTFKFGYDRSLRDGEKVVIAKFRYSHARGMEIIESLLSTTAFKTVWNLPTQDFHRVNLLLKSPNYWGEYGTGNKHYFFMLDKCVNDGQARGFYNEFLRSDLDKHRRVIEIVGSKMKTAETPYQLSGLGFSDTVRNEVVVRVKGNVNRTLSVMI